MNIYLFSQFYSKYIAFTYICEINTSHSLTFIFHKIAKRYKNPWISTKTKFFKMASLKAIGILLRLPLDLLFITIKYFLGLTTFRKYDKRLALCLKLVIYRRALSIPIKDASIIDLFSNDKLFAICKRILKSHVQHLPHFGERYGTSGIWLSKAADRELSDPIIIYSHGGGYFLQTQLEQLKSLIALSNSIDNNKKVSFLFLDYDLISAGQKFPRQLRQLHSVYQKLVEEGNTNLILFGDSAGGHLSISYTEYLSKCVPNAVYPTKMILISPWVNLATNADDYKPGLSYYDNENRDLISYHLFASQEKSLFIEESHEKHHEYFNWSLNAPVNWGENKFFNNPLSEVFLIYGEDESFRDHIHQWSTDVFGIPKIKTFGTSQNKFQPDFELTGSDKNRSKLVGYVEPWGVHDSIFFLEYGVINDYRNIGSLDENKYFSFTRLLKYLNESL